MDSRCTVADSAATRQAIVTCRCGNWSRAKAHTTVLVTYHHAAVQTLVLVVGSGGLRLGYSAAH